MSFQMYHNLSDCFCLIRVVCIGNKHTGTSNKVAKETNCFLEKIENKFIPESPFSPYKIKKTLESVPAPLLSPVYTFTEYSNSKNVQ